MRRIPYFLSVLALTVGAGALLATPREARAQSAAELEAARGLFKQGADLEKAKDYGAAYEKFRKVAAIKSTAMVRYHEGFCAEKIGKWVEALDAWSRAQIDGQGDPKQKDAVEASRKAADALRPRVPRIKVKVEGAKGTPQVSIDGAVVSAVLLEEGLPVNVGPHVVEISGGGAANDKQDVAVAEKEVKEVVFNAKDGAAGGTVVVVPPNGGNGGGGGKTGNGTGSGTGAGTGSGTGTGTGAGTGTGTGSGTATGSGSGPAAASGDMVRFGLVFGLSVASMSPGGQIHGPTATTTDYFKALESDGSQKRCGGDAACSTEATQFMSTGGAVELNLGLRFLPALAAYGMVQLGALGKGSYAKEAFTDFKVTTNAFGFGLMLNTNPRKGFGFYADAAFAFRSTATKQSLADGRTTDATLSGVEPLRLKLGAAYKPSARFTIVAFAWASVGTYTKLDYT
ncbi:MAG: hypothetical protein ABI175_16295, partial [Polyangiales bacterium]